MPRWSNNKINQGSDFHKNQEAASLWGPTEVGRGRVGGMEKASVPLLMCCFLTWMVVAKVFVLDKTSSCMLLFLTPTPLSWYLGYISL